MKCRNALEYLEAQIQNVRKSLEEVHFSQLTACFLTRVWSSNFLSIIIKSPCIYSTVFGLSHNSYSCLNIAVKSWHLQFGIYFSAGPKTDMDHQTIMYIICIWQSWKSKHLEIQEQVPSLWICHALSLPIC